MDTVPGGKMSGMSQQLLPETATLRTMRGGPASIADIAKSVDGDNDQIEATLEDLRLRQLVERDEAASTAKTPRWRLTQLGMNTVDARS